MNVHHGVEAIVGLLVIVVLAVNLVHQLMPRKPPPPPEARR